MPDLERLSDQLKIDIQADENQAKAAAFDLLSKYLHQNEIAVLEIKCTGDGGHSCGETWMEISIGSGCERDGAGDDLIETVNNAMARPWH